MNPARVWAFLVGDSRRAPIGVVLAVLVAVGIVRFAPADALFAGVVYVGIIAATVVAAVLER